MASPFPSAPISVMCPDLAVREPTWLSSTPSSQAARCRVLCPAHSRCSVLACQQSRVYFLGLRYNLVENRRGEVALFLEGQQD